MRVLHQKQLLLLHRTLDTCRSKKYHRFRPEIKAHLILQATTPKDGEGNCIFTTVSPYSTDTKGSPTCPHGCKQEITQLPKKPFINWATDWPGKIPICDTNAIVAPEMNQKNEENSAGFTQEESEQRLIILPSEGTWGSNMLSIVHSGWLIISSEEKALFPLLIPGYYTQTRMLVNWLGNIWLNYKKRKARN